MQELARRIADEVLFPAALAVDAADRVPAGHLDLLAEQGFYGLAGPCEYGGAGIEDAAVAGQILAALAGGCLATAFVWLQHHGAVRGVANFAPPQLRQEWLEALCRGRCRAGIALAGLRPGPALVRAEPVSGGYLFDGEAAWVTGWDMIDVLYVGARFPHAGADTVVWALLDPVPGRTLSVRPLDLLAVNASRTVHLRFDRHFVPAQRVTGTMPYAEWPERDAANLRLNGYFGLGLTDRCCRLIGPSPLDAELASCQAALDAATPQTAPATRSAVSELAIRAAVTLVTTVGARAVLRAEHAQRLVREATFLLVFGSRPAIRTALLERLSRR